jgi:biopolymer transport protein ExbD
MGELIDQPKARSASKRRHKNVRVDLTPMVDLGFILITFFIFTTSMSEPKSLKLRLPALTSTDSMQSAENATLNLILDANDIVWYYTGTDQAKMMSARNISQTRHIIQEHKWRVTESFGTGKEAVVLIKPSRESTYRNLVDLLDEMVINEISRHILMDPTAEELASIQQRD